MDSLSAHDRQVLQELLERRHQKLRAEIRGARDATREERNTELQTEVSDGKDVAYTQVTEEVQTAELERDLGEIKAIEAALQRLREGGYGECVDCGADIGVQRLMAQPTALRCAACQRNYEHQHRHDRR